ncbi:MAG: tripartite tricarboxylate transporter substrate binding protein [Burkholderiales bacterium]|nr:tripartite tricarboxylate transporter substrate binding protein [Burkholderiales bacterium]
MRCGVAGGATGFVGAGLVTAPLHAIFACLLLIGALPAGTAHAQQYPARPIRLVVGYTAGGATDLLARAVGEMLLEGLGQPVIVDNRPGAGSVVGSAAVARAAPDGYTLLMGAFALAVNATLQKNVPYDTVKGFAPISQVAMTPYLLVVHPSMPVKNVQQLIALAKKLPGELNYASAGTGTGAHLSGELLRAIARIEIAHVPYKGASPATVDVLGGRVTMTFVNILQTMPLVRQGRLRALGVTTAKRSSIAPDIPTIAESGVPGYELDGWFGVFAPANTPPAVLSLLHGTIVNGLKSQETRDRFLALGVEPVGNSPEEFGHFVRNEVKKWGDIVRRAGIGAP